MIPQIHTSTFWLRLAAPLAWRSDAAIASKLLGFAATEEGSARDMQRASERVDDPRLRRLFYRHARHGRMFRDAALPLQRQAGRGLRSYEALHADRQDLLERYGLVRFVAFVWLSEARAARQFEVLAARFAHRDQLRRLFEAIGHDEQFHTSYSRQLLDEWCAAGREREVRRALRSVRLSQAWMAWRRAGRRLGDIASRALLLTMWAVLVPPFALVERLSPRPTVGWHRPNQTQQRLEDLRRQF